VIGQYGDYLGAPMWLQPRKAKSSIEVAAFSELARRRRSSNQMVICSKHSGGARDMERSMDIEAKLQVLENKEQVLLAARANEIAALPRGPGGRVKKPQVLSDDEETERKKLMVRWTFPVFIIFFLSSYQLCLSACLIYVSCCWPTDK
jgi:hypothetical protein